MLDADPEERRRRGIAARQAQRVAQGRKPRGRPPLPPDPSKQRVANGYGGRRTAPRANLTDPDSRMMKDRRGDTTPSAHPTVTAMNQALTSGPGKTLYRQRGAIIEPAFGHAKHIRRLTSFRRRGPGRLRRPVEPGMHHP